jgi:hypothetical protein
MIFEKLNFLYFILAFSIGLFVCYLTNPKPEIVVKFPSPQNSGKIIYKDKSDTCYKFKSTQTACPTDTSLIKSQPITEDYANVTKQYKSNATI